VTALGVINNSINTTVTLISAQDRVGGLLGVIDTAEKLAGVVGPSIGALLYARHAMAPVAAVTAGYLTMAAAVLVGYPRFVVPAMRQAQVEPRPKQE
jgi:hypothetical protein